MHEIKKSTASGRPDTISDSVLYSGEITIALISPEYENLWQMCDLMHLVHARRV